MVQALDLATARAQSVMRGDRAVDVCTVLRPLGVVHGRTWPGWRMYSVRAGTIVAVPGLLNQRGQRASGGRGSWAPIVCGIGRICQPGCPPSRTNPVGSPPHGPSSLPPRSGTLAAAAGLPLHGADPRRGHASAERLRRGARRPGPPRSSPTRRPAPRSAARSARRAPMDRRPRPIAPRVELGRPDPAPRTVSPVEFVEAYLARASTGGTRPLGAYVTVCPGSARPRRGPARRSRRSANGAPLGPPPRRAVSR